MGLLFASQLLVLAVLVVVYTSYTDQSRQPALANGSATKEEATPAGQPSFERLAGSAIQMALISSLADLPGDYSLVVYDPVYDETVVEVEPDKVYFTASLYKLYLAFLAWQDVDQGILELDQVLLNHPTLGQHNLWQCLDLMVRVSDSPCAEALLATYDRQDLQKRLNSLSLVDVNVDQFLVSARDMTKLIALIEAGQGLSAGSREHLLASMNLQVDRQGLQQAFSAAGDVAYNKVGLSAHDWHDVGLVRLGPAKRPLILAILTNDAGVAGVAALAHELHQVLTDELPASPQRLNLNSTTSPSRIW